MAKSAIAVLEQGIWQDGAPIRDAELRPITGEDELALAELALESQAALRTTELLTRTVTRIGAQAGPRREAVRALSIGDRERLLLELYVLSFGASSDLMVTCPDPGCGEMLVIPVDLRDLIQPAAREPTPDHIARLGDAQVRFRLPTGADQEVAGALAAADLEAATDLLLDRCLIEAPPVERASLRALLASRLAELDPQAEILVDTECPCCGAAASALVDVAPLLFARMASARGLAAEVDRMARAYHWSEADILNLPVGRRKAYLELIATAEPTP
ncbi:MAG: hypothetical protein ACREE0_01295 [Phenylobacterium sp.]